MLRLENLTSLWSSMKAAGKTREQFRFTIPANGYRVAISAVFIAEDEPWQLLLGCSSDTENAYAQLRVNRGYVVDPHELTPEFIRWLCRSLHLEFDPDNRFTRWKFVENHLAKRIPLSATARKVSPADVPVPRSDIEEGDKRFFVRWLPHNNGRRVTEENLAKTKLLISAEFAAICRKKNISSCWSADRRDETEITSPP